MLHNSSVTAGISFDGEHFDEQINVFAGNTCSALSFLQGSHRVRHLANRDVMTYVTRQPKDKLPQTPAGIVQQMYEVDLDHDVQLSLEFSKIK